MSSGDLLKHFCLGMLSVGCFSVLFNTPRSVMFSAGLSGGIGWVVFLILRDVFFLSSINANLAAAIVIALLGEFFARRERKPVTMYVVPGILVLVPGYSIFRAMDMFLSDHTTEGLAVLLRASMEAGAIAVGIFLVGIGARVMKKILVKGDSDV